MGDVVLSLGEHEVGAVVVDDAHIFDPRAGEDRGCRGRGSSGCRRARWRVPATWLAGGRWRSRCTRDDRFHRRRPGYSRARGSCGPRCRGRCRRRPGSRGSASRRPMARRAGPAGRPAARDWRPAVPVRITSERGEAKASQTSGASMNHLRVPPGCEWPGIVCDRCRARSRQRVAIAPRPVALHLTLRSANLDGTLNSSDPNGAVAQLGERRVRNAEVEGSIPFRSIGVSDRRNPQYSSSVVLQRAVFGRLPISSPSIVVAQWWLHFRPAFPICPAEHRRSRALSPRSPPALSDSHGSCAHHVEPAQSLHRPAGDGRR